MTLDWTDGLAAALSALLFFIGLRKPLAPVYATIWTLPFIAGNTIAGFRVPLSPSRACAVACIAVALFHPRPQAGVKRVSLQLSLLMLAFVGLSAFGYFRVLAEAQYIVEWRQAPLEKVLRAFGTESLFWLVPYGVLRLLPAPGGAAGLLKQIIYCGWFYSGLGLLQYFVALATGFDLFPITRLDVVWKESFVDSATTGDIARITSICGEPRYLAAYTAFWLAMIVLFSRRAGFLGPRARLFSAILFGGALLLTGARTAAIVLLLVLTGSLIAALATDCARRVVQLSGILAVSATVLSFMISL